MSSWDEGLYGPKVQGISVRVLASHAYEVKRNSRDINLKKSLTVRNVQFVPQVVELLFRGEHEQARQILRESDFPRVRNSGAVHVQTCVLLVTCACCACWLYLHALSSGSFFRVHLHASCTCFLSFYIPCLITNAGSAKSRSSGCECEQSGSIFERGTSSNACEYLASHSS